MSSTNGSRVIRPFCDGGARRIISPRRDECRRVASRSRFGRTRVVVWRQPAQLAAHSALSLLIRRPQLLGGSTSSEQPNAACGCQRERQPDGLFCNSQEPRVVQLRLGGFHAFHLVLRSIVP